ncbi:MAG: CDC27 family protein [Tannerella sp.]|jgi:tetratricopeptide (TPR) repeat protein|nr:CDC27 family protein [Tannerella sp.]
MKQKFTKIFYLIFFLSISLYGYTQSLDQAKILYNEDEYEEAKPVFEKLVKQSPNNSSYNQWYGVCCYETGDYENAEKYLLVANKRKVMESYRYLAMLYTDQYRFNEAIEMWDGYITMQKKKKDDTSESEKNMELARNLLRMQDKTEDVQIIDSVVINKNVFLEAYSLSEESGTLMSYDDFFKTEKNVLSTVYMNQKEDRVYYARLSENGSYTLYSQSKLLDAWGDEKVLIPDNTKDDNYPYILSDGITMYFASKGYESIGGYDIFITRYNTNTNSYLAPEQMGMPFNSPANDYMMVIDDTKGLGWFVTDRNQPEDNVCVYLFIPDPSRKRIEGIEDHEVIRRRAALVSIKDTWKDGADYTELIKLAHTDLTQKDVKKERDFEFVINDKITYYTLNDIKSHEAKDLYSEVLNINKQIESLNNKLNDIRSSYTNGNSSVREQLKPTILQAESQLYSLMEKARVQEKKARNAEIRQIGIK